MADKSFLSEGTYGEVFLVSNGIEKKVFKKYKETTFDRLCYVLPETDIMMSMCHPNIMNGNSVIAITDGNTLTIELEMDYGVTLSDSINNLTFGKSLQYIFEIGSGEDFLLNYGKSHCDLKPSNIIIHNDVAKIIDFGLMVYNDPFSRDYDRKADLCGTFNTKPPEYYDGENSIRIENEIWAYAMLVLDIIYGIEDVYYLYCQKSNIKYTKDNIDFFLKEFQNRDNGAVKMFERIFGDFPVEFLPLVDDIGMLCHHDPKQRTKSLSNFLKNGLFVENNLIFNSRLGSVYQFEKELKSIPDDPYDRYIDVALRWGVEVLLEYDTSIEGISLYCEIFRRIYPNYNYTKEDLQCFACCCCIIASAMTGSDRLTEGSIHYITDNSVSISRMNEMIAEIINKEQSKFSYPSIYSVAKNKQAFIMAFVGVITRQVYYQEKYRSSYKIGINAVRLSSNDGKIIASTRIDDEMTIKSEDITLLINKIVTDGNRIHQIL
jgi:serine/threonine protein kinase